MLQHSITVRVQHINDYEFLSPPIMYPFVDGLAQILNTSSTVSFLYDQNNRSASGVCKHVAIGTESLGFDSQAGEIGSASPTTPIAVTFLWSCVAQVLSRIDGPATRYTLRRNPASIMKI